MNAKLVNILGMVLVLAVLGLGTLNLVMPLYREVQQLENQIVSTRDANDAYRIRVAELNDAEARRDEIESSVNALAAQIPPERLDHTALAVIENARNASGAYIMEHFFDEAVSFSPRSAAGSDAEPIVVDEIPPPPPPPGEGEFEPIMPDQLDQLGEADGRQQLSVEIVASVQSAQMANEFLDALRRGPRALLITSARAERGQEIMLTGWEWELTVNFEMFFYQSEGGL